MNMKFYAFIGGFITEYLSPCPRKFGNASFPVSAFVVTLYSPKLCWGFSCL